MVFIGFFLGNKTKVAILVVNSPLVGGDDG